MDHYVVLLHLDEEPQDLSTVPVSDLQRSQVPEDADGAVDVGRVVLVDGADTVGAHAGVIERVLSSPSVTAAVLVLFEPEDHWATRDGGIVLPPCLDRSTGLVVVWVGDPRGVYWPMGSPRGTFMSPSGPGAEAVTRATVIDVLRVPEVFDRIVAARETLASPVVSVGLRVVNAGSGGFEIAATAEGAVVERLTQDSDGETIDVRDPWMVFPPSLFGMEEANANDLDPSGPVARRASRLRLALQRARQSLSVLESGPKIAPVPDRAVADVRACGAALEELRAVAAASFAAGAGDDAGALRKTRVRPAGDVDPQANEALLQYAMQLVSQGRALPRVAHRLREIAALARPASVEEHLDMLETVCPEASGRAAVEMPHPEIEVDHPQTLFLLWSAFTFFGMSTRSWEIAVPLFGLLVAGALGVLVSGRLVPSMVRLWRQVPLRRREIGWFVVCAGAGVAAGSFVAQVATPSLREEVLAACAAAAILAYTIWSAWRRSARAWAAKASLENLEIAGDEVEALVAKVSLNDWEFGATRREFVRAANGLATFVEELSATLGADFPKPRPPARDVEGPGTALLRTDLSEAPAGLYPRTASAGALIERDYVSILEEALAKYG